MTTNIDEKINMIGQFFSNTDNMLELEESEKKDILFLILEFT